MRATRSPTLLVVAVLVLVAAAGALSSRTPTAPAASPAEPSAPAGELAARLEALRVAPEANGPSYDRDAFGGWGTGPDGCSTRERVLIDESRTPAEVQGGCRVVAGDWLSVYDGYQTTDPAELEIDHVVALAEAWESGAATWSAERRHEFANDLDHPGALVAVTAATNRAKSDHDPAEWVPPSTEIWCDYAAAWITQKDAWSLSVDQAEHDALTHILAGCPTAPGATR